MESRIFSLSNLPGVPVHTFDSVDAFLSHPVPHGVSQILVGQRYLHLLFENNGHETTLVHFGAAMPPVGWDQYPIFVGRKSAAGYPVNHLSISDPNYGLPGRPATGWFGGSDNQDLQSVLAVIIRHCTRAGVEGQAILFGSSAGGFASLFFGSKIPESITITVNPRVDLRNRPTQYYRLGPIAFPDTSPDCLDTRIVVSAADSFSDLPGNVVAYIQNVQDDTYFEGNMMPFLSRNSADRRVWLNLVDSGPGHRMPGGTIVSTLLTELVKNAPNWEASLSALKYTNAPTEKYALEIRENFRVRRSDSESL